MIRIKTRVAIVVALMMAVITACQDTLNPKVENLPATPFDYSVHEQRTEHKDFTWVESGGALDNGEESIKMLYVTAFNDVTLRVSAAVNVSSSNVKVVSVERVGSSGNTFKLHYKADGAATITMWNGTEGTDKIQRSFSVAATEFIDVKGIVFEYEGKDLVITRNSATRPKMYTGPDDTDRYGSYNYNERDNSYTDYYAKQLDKPAIWIWENYPYDQVHGDWIADPDQGTVLSFKGIIPENTSFRTLKAFESEWDYLRHYPLYSYQYTEAKNHGPWPNDRETNCDVSHYIGVDTWVAEQHTNCYVANLKIQCGEKYKYFWLYYSRAADEANKISQQP